ncbi:protocadherin gamma-B5-like isoform X40 [Pseudophryne corroboree]|uniref:protocadherin gamma-B5-like isoform X40 n=1 Tax=Pseudophryne corroboree TaxID=495146 RepID=UPI0030820E87
MKWGLLPRSITWQVLFYSFSFWCDIISAQLQYSIPEELKQGSRVGNIADDLSLNVKDLSRRKFQIVSHGRKQYFNVNLQNGDLYVANRVDREALCGNQQSCFFNIEAVIENPLQFYSCTVEIQDVNDNVPHFSKSVFDLEVSELILPGTRFALGTAKDPDSGINSLQGYKLSDNNYFILGEKTSKDGKKDPELVLDKPLDREKQNYFELILIAFDGGKPVKSGTALVKITVHDVNDNFPIFSQDAYQITVNENVPNGFLILQLNATDEDDGSNAEIMYSLSDISETTHQLFAIDPMKGEIIVTGKLDYEVTDNYEFTVEAKDGGGLASHCKVFIQITDVNDNAPEITITSLSASIPEDSPPGTVIALVNIYDMDTGKNGEVVCDIDGKLPFHLVSSSTSYYKLVTSTSLDRERVSEYNITMTARDGGSPSLSVVKTIKLVVSDVNDNPPAFEKTNYIVYIEENNLPGTSVYGILASDHDYEENAKITYSIFTNNSENTTVSSYISINSMTGVLYAQRSFDYEQLREFQFQVMAKDSGSPPLSSNVTVMICIIDKNDNAPKILYPSPDTEGSALFEFIPHSAEKGYLVTKVIAVDADSGHNAWLSYHLLQATDSLSFFNIDGRTGEIRVGRKLQNMDSSRQKIVLMVKDNGNPSLSSTVSLTLVVAESFQQVLPEIIHKPSNLKPTSNITFFLVVSIALISLLFIVTVMVTAICKCRKSSNPPSFGALNRNVYPQFSLGCPSEFSDGSLPYPFSYDVCVTLDSKQNEIAYLKPVQNVPTDNLIDTGDSATRDDSMKDCLTSTSAIQQAQPNTEWRFSQAQRPGPSGAQPAEEAGVWPNNQFETERLQAMILASANEAAEGTSGLGGGTGTMGLSARYGPQFTLQHVPDYRQNVYIPGSTLTPTNAGGKRDGKGGGNKKKSGKKEKK